MRFGVFFPSQAPNGISPRNVFAAEIGQIEYAEELGYDGVWLAEHHFTDYCIVNDPLTYAAHVAARTEQIRIGLAVSILPLHNPIELAERCALVDHLSNGRLDVGFGRGYSGREFANYGIDRDERRARFEEALELILNLWTHERTSFAGRFWAVEDASLVPKPLQAPHPPVYIASSGSPDTIALAAEHAFPVLQGVDLLKPAQVSERYAAYRKTALDAGRSDADIDRALAASAVTQKVFVAPDREAAYEIPAPYALWRHRRAGELLPKGPPPTTVQRLRRHLRPARRAITGSSAKEWDEVTWEELRSHDLYGKPEDCIERLRLMEDAGAKTVVCWFAYGGMPDAHVREAMRVFAGEVMPAFQDERQPSASRTEALVR